MTSKKLGALLRSVPPATAVAAEEAPSPLPQAPQSRKPPARLAPTPSRANAHPPSAEPEVPLQVLIPANIRRQLAIKAAEQGESLRSLVLQAIRGLGIDVTDADIRGKRGRRSS